MTYRIAAPPVEEVPKPRRQVDPLKLIQLIAITGYVLMLVFLVILAQDDRFYWGILFFAVADSPFLLLLFLD